MEYIFQFTSIIVAITGIIISVPLVFRQLRIQLYADYSKRYEMLMLEMMKTEDVTLKCGIAKQYIDLCSEEIQIHKQKYVKGWIWKQWKDGIKCNLQNEPFSSQWEYLSRDDYYDADFKDFILNLITKDQ